MLGVPIFAALLMLQGRPDTANVGVRAVYDVTRTEASPAGSGSANEKVTRFTGTVRITADVLAVREGDHERVHDFANRRIVWLDHASKEAHDTSLYVVVAARDLELASVAGARELMGQALDMEEMVRVETEAGMRLDAPAKVNLEERRRDGLRVFVLNGREVTSFLGADRSMPPALSPMLTRLYLYATQVHPLVRSELVKAARLPVRLEFRSGERQAQETTTWSLRALADEPLEVAAARTTYPMKPIESEELVELALRVRTGRAGSPPPSTAYIDRAKRLLEKGRGFEAVLTLLELSYATGEVPSDELLRLSRDRARSDPRTKVVAGLEGSDPEKALAQLEALDPRSLEGGHIIHVLRAEQWLRLLEGKEVLQEFGRMEPLQELGLALKANPFLVGAWINAGLYSYAGWQTQRAWACWDAARAIAPGNAMLELVEELEASLRTKHPEWF